MNRGKQTSYRKMEKLSLAESSESLTLNFGPLETVHQWQRKPDLADFIGARYSYIYINI